MKKRVFMWLSILFLAAVCVGFASCGDDDDDGNGVITGGGMELPKNVTLVKTTVPADENSTREIEFFTLQDGTGYYNAEYNRYTAIPRPDLSPTSLDAANYYVFPFFEERYSRTDGEPNIFSHDTNENFNVVYDEQNGRYVVRDDYGVMTYWRVLSKSDTQCQISKVDDSGTIVNTETFEIRKIGSEYSKMTYWEYNNQTPIADEQGESNGGGGNGGSGGNGGGTTDEWEAISAPGYLPYYYCPTDRTTTPSYPRSTTHTVYKNKNTGAYKITWAGVTYAAYRGSNKITIGRDYHTTYNTTIKRWMSCTDYYYLEFTIY